MKLTRFTLALPVALTILTFSNASNCSAQIDSKHCLPIITDGLREVDVDINSSSYLNSIFDEYCDESRNTKDSRLSVGIDAVKLPLKFSLGTSSKKESMQKFCREYQSDTTIQSSAFRRDENIVHRAYQSFDRCTELAALGIKVTYSIRSLQFVDFFISPAIGQPLTLNGVQTSSNIKCQATTGGQFYSSLDSQTRISLSTEPLNIICERGSHNLEEGGRESIVYDEAVVTLLTNLPSVGNFGILMPRDRRLPDATTSVLEAKIQALESAQDKLASNQANLQSQIQKLPASVEMSPELPFSISRGDGMNQIDMGSYCPPDQVVVGVQLIVAGTCRGMCNGDGGTIHKFRVRCAPRFRPAE